MVQPTYTGPAHPISYIELQASWVAQPGDDGARTQIDELRAKGLTENPGYRQADQPHRARLEWTQDGAGVLHYTLYMGFQPDIPAAEPLNPHNLGDAPLPQSGWPEPTDGIMPLGTREQKF